MRRYNGSAFTGRPEREKRPRATSRVPRAEGLERRELLDASAEIAAPSAGTSAPAAIAAPENLLKVAGATTLYGSAMPTDDGVQFTAEGRYNQIGGDGVNRPLSTTAPIDVTLAFKIAPTSSGAFEIFTLRLTPGQIPNSTYGAPQGAGDVAGGALRGQPVFALFVDGWDPQGIAPAVGIWSSLKMANGSWESGVIQRVRVANPADGQEHALRLEILPGQGINGKDAMIVYLDGAEIFRDDANSIAALVGDAPTANLKVSSTTGPVFPTPGASQTAVLTTLAVKQPGWSPVASAPQVALRTPPLAAAIPASPIVTAPQSARATNRIPTSTASEPAVLSQSLIVKPISTPTANLASRQKDGVPSVEPIEAQETIRDSLLTPASSNASQSAPTASQGSGSSSAAAPREPSARAARPNGLSTRQMTVREAAWAAYERQQRAADDRRELAVAAHFDTPAVERACAAVDVCLAADDGAAVNEVLVRAVSACASERSIQVRAAGSRRVVAPETASNDEAAPTQHERGSRRWNSPEVAELTLASIRGRLACQVSELPVFLVAFGISGALTYKGKPGPFGRNPFYEVRATRHRWARRCLGIHGEIDDPRSLLDFPLVVFENCLDWFQHGIPNPMPESYVDELERAVELWRTWRDGHQAAAVAERLRAADVVAAIAKRGLPPRGKVRPRASTRGRKPQDPASRAFKKPKSSNAARNYPVIAPRELASRDNARLQARWPGYHRRSKSLGVKSGRMSTR